MNATPIVYSAKTRGQSVLTKGFFKPQAGFDMLLVILMLNILAVDFFVIQALKTPTSVAPVTKTASASPIPTPSIIQNTPQPTNVESVNTATYSKPPSTTSKEFYIPLGSGTITSTDWILAPGVQAYLDPNTYTSIKRVTLEASISIPTANQFVMVQLINNTLHHPVWGSEMTLNGGNSSGYIVSQPLTLDSGNNLYQVEMKTQLGSPATLTQARIHITTY